MKIVLRIFAVTALISSGSAYAQYWATASSVNPQSNDSTSIQPNTQAEEPLIPAPSNPPESNPTPVTPTPPVVVPTPPAQAAACNSITLPAASKLPPGNSGFACQFQSFNTGDGNIGDTYDQPSTGVNGQPVHNGCNGGNKYSFSHVEGEETGTCTASGWSAPKLSCACLAD